MATFSTGGFAIDPTYNFVSTAELVRRHVDPRLNARFGTQTLNMLYAMGYKKSVPDALIYEHYEDSRLMPKAKASVSQTTGGALATFTFTVTSPAQQFAMAQFSPYEATSPTTYIAGCPIREHDVIEIFSQTGVASAANAVQVHIMTVNAEAGTFAGYEKNGQTIPALTDAEITILYNEYGEKSTQAQSFANNPQKYSNSLQVLKEALEISNLTRNMILYAHETKTYQIKKEEECYTRLENYRELALMVGTGHNNLNLANALKLTPLSTTVGAIPTILSNGVVKGYAKNLGFGVPQFQDLTAELDLNKGSKENLMKVGLRLGQNINLSLGDYFKNGSISYGFFGGGPDGKKKAVDLTFDSLADSGYTFHVSTIAAFTDLQTLGAAGRPYPFEGLVLPTEAMNDAKSGDSISAIRIRYQEGNEMWAQHRDMRQFSDDGRDSTRVDYGTTVGLEMMGVNRTAYIKVQSN